MPEERLNEEASLGRERLGFWAYTVCFLLSNWKLWGIRSGTLGWHRHRSLPLCFCGLRNKSTLESLSIS
jgi:hypothetical protein